MNILRVSLFGKFQVCRDEKPLAGLEARKVQELFCYLLLHRNRSHAREAVSGLLWDSSTDAQAKKYLRQALWQLQVSLDDQRDPIRSRLLLVEPHRLRVNPEALLWLDVQTFEQAFASAQGIPGQKLDPQTAQALQAATELYRGDLLEGWYHDWCLFDRERLQNIYLDMLNKLMDYHEAHHEYQAGLADGLRILHLDRAHEAAHRMLMRLHYRAGDRTAALRQYERCVSALTEELDVQPAPSTVILYEAIRAGRYDQPSSNLGAVIPPSEPGTMAMSELLSRLQQFETRLTSLQGQLQQYTNTVEPDKSGRRSLLVVLRERQLLPGSASDRDAHGGQLLWAGAEPFSKQSLKDAL